MHGFVRASFVVWEGETDLEHAITGYVRATIVNVTVCIRNGCSANPREKGHRSGGKTDLEHTITGSGHTITGIGHVTVITV